MNEPAGLSRLWGIDKTWTLFLDRDGVINKRLPGNYVKHVREFVFLDGVLEAIPKLNQIFGRLILVTNQQGIGKGLMTEHDLKMVHDYMLEKIREHGGKLDAVYFSPYRAEENHMMRKPNTGMAMKAKEDFPEIDFAKSVMVGDSLSDVEFGKRCGMKTVFVVRENTIEKNDADLVLSGLKDFAVML
ncbi:MAG: HAD family hydrolase [Bacteroidia bacterium]|nr:HAD family hydrolase [Bacteroidia bacterium]